MTQYTMKILACLCLAALSTPAADIATPDDAYIQLRESLIARYSGKTPQAWGARIPGMKTRFVADTPTLAITLDACRGAYDAALLSFLNEEKIPVTMFVSGKWIGAHGDILAELAANPLCEIENHGLEHRPLSVNGKSVYKVKGTRNVGEVVDEIELNARKIAELTGRRPRFLRPATGYADDIALEIAHDLNFDVVTFSVIGDGGATFTAEQVRTALLKAPTGSIVCLHMNHPEGHTAEGVMAAIPELKKAGVRFLRLSECVLKE